MSRSTVLKSMDADPDVKIPAAIRAAALRSDALHKEAYNPGNDDKQGDNNGQQENGDGGTEGQSQETKPVATEQAPAPQPEPAATPAQPSQSGDWEAKYNSMKGRFDKGQEIINNLRGQVAMLEAKLAAQPAPAPAQAPANPEMAFKPLTAEERETYGDEFIDVATRAAAEKFGPTITTLKAQLDRVNEELAESKRQNGQKQQLSVHEHLDQEVPNWRALNRDQNFLDWCDLQDPFSGATRRAMLREAFAQGDAKRVTAFFKGFLNEATPDPAKGQNAPPAKSGKPTLESLAAPGRAKAPAAAETAPGQKETISRSQIANFYALVNKGHYRGNEAERDRLEQMIFAAERDGLIVD